MIDFYPQDPRYYLQNELRERLKRRPRYSLRAFARDLEVSASALSSFLNDQTPFSVQRISELAKKIKLPAEHTEHWQDLIEWKFGRSTGLKKKAELKIEARSKASKKYIDLESFKFIARWEALALLELFGFEKKFSESEICRYLNLKKTDLQELTQNLLRLGLISWSQDRWRPVQEDSFVGQDVPSSAVREFHKGILKKATAALEKKDLQRREFRSTVFSLRKEDLPRLKQDLNRFWMEQIGKYAKPTGNDSVYCFSMQLFDLLNGEIQNG
jgi:uncharacterized protein (TIGR02147 family)